MRRSATAQLYADPAHTDYLPVVVPIESDAANSGTWSLGNSTVLKRMMDLTGASVAMLILLPLMLLISLIIRIQSKGPVLFCQQRTGYQGVSFTVYKFRTMHHEKNEQFKQATRHDPRITSVGAILRRTSLDELPQLFNVLEGSMSLVGPRPHPAALDAQFMQRIPRYRNRFSVKPGITGLAQINGFRGETVQLRDMVGRIEKDNHYIKHWNIWLDLQILVKTAYSGWVDKNAY